MLHTAKLETGQDNQIVFGKRIVNTRKSLLPGQGIKHLISDIRTLRPLFRVGFPMIDRDLTPVTLKPLTLQTSGDE